MKRLTLFTLGFMFWMPTANAATMDESIASLQQQWAVIKYQMPDKEAQEEAIAKLADSAAQISQVNPGKAEPLVWQAIIVFAALVRNIDMGTISVCGPAGSRGGTCLFLQNSTSHLWRHRNFY